MQHRGDDNERERRPRRESKPVHNACRGEAIESDESVGQWARSELLEMQERFEQAIARELRPKQH